MANSNMEYGEEYGGYEGYEEGGMDGSYEGSMLDNSGLGGNVGNKGKCATEYGWLKNVSKNLNIQQVFRPPSHPAINILIFSVF